MDPAASLSGFLTRSAITRHDRAVSSMGEALVEQCPQRGQGISDRVDAGICGRRAGNQRAAGCRGQRGGNSDGFPAVDRGVSSGHEGGEQRRHYVFAAAGEDAIASTRRSSPPAAQEGTAHPASGPRSLRRHARQPSSPSEARLIAVLEARPRARFSGGSRRPARGEPSTARDLVEVIVGEPVPAQAQLPGQAPLAEPLAARGRMLVDSGGVLQQAGIWVASSATVLRRAVWRGGLDNHRHATRYGRTMSVPGVRDASISVAGTRSCRLASSLAGHLHHQQPTDKPANAASGLVAAVSRSARITGRPGPAWMWPMFPATLTVRPVSAVAQGQIRCRAGQPSR